MVDLSQMLYKLRYGTEEEAEKALVEFIKEAKEKGSEEALRPVRRFFLGLLTEPKSKTKIVALRALAKVGLWDTEILETVFDIAKNSDEIQVREEAEKAILALLEKAKDREKALHTIIKAIDKRRVVLSPADAVEAVGLETAKGLMESDKISRSEKDLLDFAIKYVEEKLNKEKKEDKKG